MVTRPPPRMDTRFPHSMDSSLPVRREGKKKEEERMRFNCGACTSVRELIIKSKFFSRYLPFADVSKRNEMVVGIYDFGLTLFIIINHAYTIMEQLINETTARATENKHNGRSSNNDN